MTEEKTDGEKKIKISECSNFAYHAISILLSDPKVSDEYNVCIAGIGDLQNHNIVILLPKSAPPFNGKNLPKGSLIIDPGAMVLGYSAEKSLAVEPKNYAHKDLLEKKISLGYQSIKDPTVTPNAVSPQSRARLSSSASPLSPSMPVLITPPRTPPSTSSRSSSSLSMSGRSPTTASPPTIVTPGRPTTASPPTTGPRAPSLMTELKDKFLAQKQDFLTSDPDKKETTTPSPGSVSFRND